MTRIKIILITIFSIMLLTSVLYTVSNKILLESFQEIENEQMIRNLVRVDSAVQNYQSTLSIQMRDWAEWDDTYEYIQNQNEEYVSSNLSDGSLINLEINFMAFIADTGEIISSFGVDLSEETSVPSRVIIEGLLKNSHIQSSIRTHSEISILLEIEDELIFVGLAPITKTDGYGDSHGSILFARIFDDSMKEKLIDLTQLDLTLKHTNTPKLSQDMVEANKEIKTSGEYFVRAFSEQEIAGYTDIRDTEDNSLAIIKVVSSRDIYKHGKHVVFIFTVISSCAILLFGVVILISFEILLLRRLSRLSKEVAGISINTLEDAHIQESGFDEIGTLASKINNLFTELAKAHTEEMKARQLEKEVSLELKKSLKETEEMNKLMVGRELKMIELKKELANAQKKSSE